MKGKQQKQQSKAGKGSVGIEAREGRLRLNIPRPWFSGTQKRLTLGLADTPENRVIAAAKAREIERDYALDAFDETLAKYKPKTHLTPVTAITAAVHTPLELYSLHTTYLAPRSKESTREFHKHIGRILEKLPKMPVTNALAVREAILAVTTPKRAKRVFMGLSAACNWGIEHELVTSNPYARLVQSLDEDDLKVKNKADAFTPEEADALIELFKTDDRPGMNYRHYAPFVEFLFLTGCRPSEAVGLQWQDVHFEKGYITMGRSISQPNNGRKVHSDTSKNRKTRMLPLYPRLLAFMTSLSEKAGDSLQSDALIFPAPKGGSITFANFRTNAWNKLARTIKPDVSPYSCRDTFITAQLAKGSGVADIARWCDTSAEMIEKHYSDKSKLLHIMPKD
ncbi:MAG: tyrosine-type recombinase/integrase [Stenomitos rutilans HA7619-LM2]|jgi:integrase|nr:tyrosine-type recombinase/integrase [Stenomitos rutilans HA7619-LM2]